MKIDYSGKTVVITGAGGFIGSASARLFAQLGARVIAVDIDKPSLAELAESVTADAGEFTTAVAALTDPDTVDALVDGIMRDRGRIDLLFNNAGGMMPTPMSAIDRAEFERLRALNFDAVYHACIRALPGMVEVGGGVILTTTSSAGTGAVRGLGVYGAAKAGVNSLMRSIAVEYGKDGIRANAIAPSAASPGMLAYLETLPGGRQGFIESQPMGRVGTAAEVAQVAAFLGSEYASFVNGVVLPVDGGIEALLATPQ